MKIEQISLFAENKPGHIATPARLLAREGIDIRSLYLADTQQYGILRMIVSDRRKATQILEANGYVVKGDRSARRRSGRPARRTSRCA